MTRDEFEATLTIARKFGGFGLDPYFESMRAHDAEQRQVIEDLQKRLALLQADDAERCTLIRDMEEEERKKDAVIEQQAQQIARLENGLGCSRSHPHEDMNQICELRTEVARLNNELSQRTNLEGSAPCWNSAHMKQIATLREVLGKLVKEIDGILGIGEEQIRNIVGNTNVNVLHIKIAIAQQALKETTT